MEFDFDTVCSQVKEALDAELETKGYNPLPEIVIQSVIGSIFALGYTVISKHPVSEASGENFQRVIEQWTVSEIIEGEVELTIPGMQIIQHLIGEGWIILPPL
jgi:hypothetical protein